MALLAGVLSVFLRLRVAPNLALGLTVWALLIDMVLLTTKRQLQLYEQISVGLSPSEGRLLKILTFSSLLSVLGAKFLLGMPLGCFLMAMTICSFTVGYINIPTHTNLLTRHASAGDDYLAAQLAESTSYGGVVANLMTAGLSKQIEHHLYPNAPFLSLPLMTPIVRAYAHEHGVAYNSFSSFWTCLVSWYRQVCFLARDPRGGAQQARSAKATTPTCEVPAIKSLEEYRKIGDFNTAQSEKAKAA